MLIRELVDDDLPFLQEMLHAALDWRPDVELPPRELILAHPQVVIFHEGWGRDGDAGLVAEEDGRPVGAVWWRLFTEDSHGEGYVGDETPELAIAVVEEFRGRGIGSALMQAIHAHGRELGLRRVSLSVDADNPAKRLYVALGYVEHPPGHEDGRMLLELG